MYEKIQTIFETFEDQVNQKNLNITTECTDILINTEIEVDEPRLGLILFNILNNSIKYTRPNDTIRVKAKLVSHD